MFYHIDNYKNLFVTDIIRNSNREVRIIYSNSYNLVVDGQVVYPFATDIKSGASILVSNGHHIKRLKYFVNCFGFPRKMKLETDKEKQHLVIKELDELYKMGRI